jgi:ATP-dependent DNA helicase RecG
MTKPRPPNALEKMGLNSPIALALHLPSRYEDETALYSIEDALIKGSFSAVQTQGKGYSQPGTVSAAAPVSSHH